MRISAANHNKAQAWLGDRWSDWMDADAAARIERETLRRLAKERAKQVSVFHLRWIYVATVLAIK